MASADQAPLRPKVFDRDAIDRVANIYFTKNDDAGVWETQASVAAA